MPEDTPASEREPRTKEDGPSDKPDEAELTGTAFYVVISTALLAVVLVAMNGTMIGTAIPSITTEFQTIEDVGWYSASNFIASCAMIPFMGTLYRLFNIKTLFLLMILIFELGTAVSGSAKTSAALIVGRAISGVGGSGIVSGMMTIMAATIPLRRRAMINGLAIAFLTLGQTSGPVIGGLLAEYASWRWCFYINLPLGGAVILGIGFFVHLPVTHLKKTDDTFLQKLMTIDVVGFVLFPAACAMLLLGLQWGGTRYSWSSRIVIGVLCGGSSMFAVLLGWFIYKKDAALIPPRLLNNRINIALTVTAFAQGGSVFLSAFWLAIWFQGVKGATPLMSGVMILPMAIAQLVGSVLCGYLVQKWGYYLPAVMAGNMMAAIAAGLTSTFHPDTSVAFWVGSLILIGVGRGCVLQLLPTAIQANLPAEDASIGSALIMFAQYFGGSLFTSLGKTIFTESVGPAVRKYAPNLDPSLLIQSGVTDLRSTVPAAELDGALMAYNASIDNVFYIQLASACAAAVAGAFVGWRKISPKKRFALGAQKGPPPTGANNTVVEKRESKEINK